MHTEQRQANLIRPGTLVQVQQLVGSGEKLRFCMAGFLDDFYRDVGEGSRLGHVAEDPGLTGDARINALIGAVGEHLARRWNLVKRLRGPTSPNGSWTVPGSCVTSG